MSAHPSNSSAGPDAWEYSVGVPHDPRGCRIARETVRAILDAHELPELAYPAQLLSSEILTHAYLFSRGEAQLRMSWTTRTLRLAVWAADPKPGAPQEWRLDGDDGDRPARGLYLVQMLADSWGHYPLAVEGCEMDGKVTWCEVSRDSVLVPC